MYRPEKCFKDYEGNKCDLCGQCIRDAQRREKESFVKASKYDRMVDLIKIPMKYGMVPTIRKLRTIIDETIKSDSKGNDLNG